MWGLFVGAAAAVLAPAGPGALVPLKLALASADSVGNDVYVAVVVDFGNGSSMTTVSKCVPVASNARDSDALAEAVGSSNVAYGSSGLLCAIDNYPSNGVQNCGESVGNGEFDYWSYWHGASGSWVYSDNGPAEQSVSSPANDVEGWRFQLNEPDTPSEPAPSVAPSYAQICNASTEVPPAQAASGPAATAAPAPGPTASVTPTTATSSAAPGVPATTTTVVATKSKAAGGITTTTTTASPSGGTATGPTTTTMPSSVDGGSRDGSSAADRHALAAAATRGNSSPGASSTLLPVILVAVVIAALGALALYRWRRRPAEE
jgi:hypothetical protein